VAGVIGVLMAKEALAILDGQPTLGGTLFVYDARSGEGRRAYTRPRASCPACSLAPTLPFVRPEVSW
jgi:molybdopterin/thiamine biosynthesis adenylyltransferase